MNSINLGTISASVNLELGAFNLDVLRVKYAVAGLSKTLGSLNLDPARMNAGLGKVQAGIRATGLVVSEQFGQSRKAAVAEWQKISAGVSTELDRQKAYQFKHNEITGAAYKGYLATRLGDYEKYSAGWSAVGDKMLGIEKQQQAQSLRQYRDSQRQRQGVPTGNSPASLARQEIGGAVTNAAVGVGVAGAVMAGASAKAAATFDEEARHTNQALHLTGKAFDALKDRVLAMTKDSRVVQSPADLMAALYPILSLPKYNTLDKALPVLKQAAYAATAGRTSAMASQDVLTSALLSGVPGTSNPKRVVDTIYQGVQTGKYEFSDLGQDFGTVLSTAKLLPGVTFQDVTAAQALMTDKGLNLPEANTALNNFLAHILHAHPQSMAAMDQMGIKYGSSALKGTTLTGYLEDASARMKDYAATHDSIQVGPKAVRKISGYGDLLPIVFPELRAMKGGAFLGDNGEDNFRKFHGIIDGAGQGKGALMGAVDEQTQGANTQWAKLQQTFQRIEIDLGTRLLPRLETFAHWLETAADALDKLDKKTGGKAGDALLYGSLGIGVLGVGGKIYSAVKGFFTLFKDAGLGANIGKVGTAIGSLLTRLGIGGAAEGTGLLARLGLPGLAVAGTAVAGGLVARDFNTQRETNGLYARSAGLDSDLTHGGNQRRKIMGQAIVNRQEASAIQDEIKANRTQIAALLDAGKRAKAAGFSDQPQKAEAGRLQGRNAALEHDRQALLKDAGRLDQDAKKLTAPILRQIAAGIETPEAKATCALFASKMMAKMGEAIPTTASAKGLADYVKGHGGTPVPLSKAKPGDLIVYHGPNFGARQGGGARSGYHVGVSTGGTATAQSSDGRVTYPNVADVLRRNGGTATAYHMGGAAPAKHFDFPENPFEAEAAHKKAVKDEETRHKEKLALMKKHAREIQAGIKKERDDLYKNMGASDTEGFVNIAGAFAGPLKAGQDYIKSFAKGVKSQRQTAASAVQSIMDSANAVIGAAEGRRALAARADAAEGPLGLDPALDSILGPIEKKPKAPARKSNRQEMNAGDPDAYESPVLRAIHSIPDAMGNAAALSVEKWRGFKGFFQDLAGNIKTIFAEMVGQMIAKWAAFELFKVGSNPFANLFGGAAGKGGDPGMGGGLGSLGGLLGKGGGLLGGIGKALPFVGAGLALNSLLGNPLKKIFHFSQGGVVPGHGFSDTVPAMLTPGERVLTRDQQRQGASGGHTITLNHYGDNHGAGDVTQMHSDFAWHVAQQLSTAVPGN